MIQRRLLLPCISSIFSAAIAAYGQSPQTIFLPPVNLAATETAQIQIMSSAAAYVGGTFLTPCNAVVTFYGAGGSALGTAANFTIGDTRQIFSAQLPYASTGVSGVSTAVNAQIALSTSSGVFSVLAPPIPPCAVVYALDTHDTATGVTHAFVAGWAMFGAAFSTGIGATVVPCPYGFACEDIPASLPKSPENIVLPPIGLGPSETVEVNLLNNAKASPTGVAASCNGSVSIYDAAGSGIASAQNTETPASFKLGTGEIYSVKLPDASAPGAAPSTPIRAEIALAPAASGPPLLGTTLATPPCDLVFSFETYDSTTGITHAFVSGTTAQGASTRVSRSTSFH